jgi:hypothetical protein
MSLSPEVQASIIKVAGDWALAITNKEKPSLKLSGPFSRGDFIAALSQNFEGAYQSLVSIVEQR